MRIHEPPLNPGSFNSQAQLQLAALWSAIHRNPLPSTVKQVLDNLVPNDLSTTWPSAISDDHTPYEFSIQLRRGKPTLRLLAEVLPRGKKEVRLVDTVLAGRNFLRALAETGVDISRFDRVASLFLPDDGVGDFALWFGAEFESNGDVAYKVYLNPQIRGAIEAPRLTEEALCRLGIAGGWQHLTRTLSRGIERDVLRYVSLDLGRSDRARVKVYAFHQDATVDYLTEVASGPAGFDKKRLASFCRKIVGGDGLLRASRSPATCFAFVAGESTPSTCTTHIPIRAFVDADATAHARILDLLGDLDLEKNTYENVVDALVHRPLEAGRGQFAWVSLRTGESPIVNVYMAAQVLHSEPVHPLTTPIADPDQPESVVQEQESNSFIHHPLMQRMAREPFNLHAMTLVLLNVREAVARNFTRRLASVIARVEEEAIRSILAKQLNDELGNGNPDRTHRILFDVMLEGLEPWAPAVLTDELLEPGRTLSAVQEELYIQRSAYEGVGATIAMEIGGKQFDIFAANQFRRKREALPPTVLEWLTLHEELEVDHVNESFDLARLVPRGSKARQTARGAREVREAGWTFFDHLYQLCYRGST